MEINSASDPAFSDKALEGWTKSEKFELLQALGEFGSSDIEQIKNFVSTKSEKQIQAAIEYYKSKALQNPEVISKRKKRIVNTCTTPLAHWATALSDTHSYEELKTDIATALRLIAEFEDKSPIICTEKFNFKSVYHILANALDGKVLAEDLKSKSVIEKCIIDTAYTSKSLIKNSVLKQIVHEVNLSGNQVSMPTKITYNNVNPELGNIRYLINKKPYNPLNISERELKFH